MSETPTSTKTVGSSSRSSAKEGSVTLHYPMLTRTNYLAWSIKMRVYMEAQGVWEAVEAEEDVDVRLDRMALAAIYQGVSEETLLLVSDKVTSREAWASLKAMYMGADRVTRVKVQTLKAEFDNLKMKESEGVDEFASRVSTIVSKMRLLGETLDEFSIVEKVLRVLTPKYSPVASTLEQFGNLKKMSMEELFGRLKVHEERWCTPNESEEEKLLMTQSKLEEKEQKWEPASENSFRGGRGSYRGRGRRGRVFYQGHGREWKFDKAKVKCYECHEYGHFADECNQKSSGKALVIEKVEDDEQTLL